MSSCNVCKASISVKANLCASCGTRMLQRLEKQQARALKNAEIATLSIEDYVIEWEEELVETGSEDMDILEQTLDAKLEELYERKQVERNALTSRWRANTQSDTKKILSEESIRERTYLEHELSRLNSLNLLNEVFHIWYLGPFGTINGLRLGRTMEIQVKCFGCFTKVPWAEINAACGQCVLLLDAFSMNHKITSSKYRLVPMGSSSRIIELNPERRNHLL
jgi:beclin 1